MAAWTDPQEVVDTWVGDDAPSDVELVRKWVDKAERLLRRKVPTLAERITAGEEDLLENTRDVVGDMVARKFRNPEGIRQVQEGVGPFSESRTYGGDNPGALVVTDEELERLSNGEAGTRRAFSIDMLPEKWRA